MEPVQNYQILLNSSLIAFNLLLLETTIIFSKKPSETLKSTLITLFQKMTLLQKMTLFQKMRLLKAILLATQISQMNPMNPILVNSLAKRTSIQWIKGLLWALITQD